MKNLFIALPFGLALFAAKGAVVYSHFLFCFEKDLSLLPSAATGICVHLSSSAVKKAAKTGLANWYTRD